MNQNDLSTFFSKYVPAAPKEGATVFAYQGEPQESGDGGEALLDIEYMMGVAPGVKTEFYLVMTSLDDFCGDLKAWTSLLLATDDLPLVHSISYAYQGDTNHLGCGDQVV